MKYHVAKQDDNLHPKLDDIPSVPIIYLNNTQVTIRSISEATKKKAEAMRVSNIGMSHEVLKELNQMREMKMEWHLTEKQKNKIKKEKDYYNQSICMGKRRKTKGPNPLSRKKKKTE
jgi:ABC-type lipoprotein export system ATPase subunit